MKFLLGADVSFVTLSLRSGDPMLSDYLKGDSDLSRFYSRYFLRLYSTIRQNLRRFVVLTESEVVIHLVHCIVVLVKGGKNSV